MNFCNHFLRLLMVFVLLAMLVGTGLAQTGTGLVRKTLEEHEKGMAAEGEAQKTRESWVSEKARLLGRLEDLERETRDLSQRRDRQLRTRDHLTGEVEEIRRELGEARRLEAELDGKLEDLVRGMEGAVSRDLPFLQEERTRRLAMLKELLVDPEAPPAERLRRVLESLRIEADYGFTVEVSRETLKTDPGEVVAQVLRVGRLALFYRTEDGRVGHYDPAEGRWLSLDKNWEAPMARAFDVATRRRAPELVSLPLGRMVP